MAPVSRIVQFVRDRYTEAQALLDDPGLPDFLTATLQDGSILTVWEKDHARAELQAKLEQLEMHDECGSGLGYCDDGGHGWTHRPPEDRGCADLAYMAAPYVAHPDYRPEWRP
jgi:hypothetical protein